MSFSKWVLKEDVTNERKQFLELCKNTFPNPSINNEPFNVSVIVHDFYGRNISLEWWAGQGLKHTNVGTATRVSMHYGNAHEEKSSYVEINFFFTDESTMGGASKPIPKNLQTNSVAFTKVMLGFLKNLKALGIHILFYATSMDRADAYASILQRAGYTLGFYHKMKQFWLAKPIDDYKGTNNPYSNPDYFIQKKQQKREPLTPTTTTQSGWGTLSM